MRFSSFMIAAVGVHLLIPIGARIAPRWDTLLVAESSGLAHRMLVEIEPIIEVPQLPEELLRPDQPREMARTENVQPRTNIDPSNLQPSNPNPDSTAVIPPDIAPPAPTGSGAPPDEYGHLPPTGDGPGGVPGLGGPLWAIPGVVPEAGRPKPAPTTIAAAPPTDPKLAGRIISDVVREKDQGLGLALPGVGTIATAIQGAVRGSTTPDVARATLEVRIGPNGRVTSVKVIRSNAGTAGDWNAVASAAQGSLSGASFPLPEQYAKGAIVTVEVISQLQMPDGTVSGRPGISGGSGDSVGGTMTFDASNIGARPKRLVKAFASPRPGT